MSKPKWQVLTDEECERTEVLRVSGGWLYRTRTYGYDRDGEANYHLVPAVALTFQPERS